MSKLENKNILVEIDEKTGYTTLLQAAGDPWQTNWILSNSNFGAVDHFQLRGVQVQENGVTVRLENQQELLSITVRKTVDENKYTETYTLTNNGPVDYFINKDSFGIHLPFASHVVQEPSFIEKCCNAHVWCGDNVCWVYCVKLSGMSPYLIMNMSQGGICDYSISRDASRAMIGADYRGDIVLNPSSVVILPGQSVTYSFDYQFTDREPMEALQALDGFLSLTADKYSAHIGEPIRFTVSCSTGLAQVSAACDGKPVPVELDDCTGTFALSFDTLGEKKITVEANGKKTFAYVNVLRHFSEILKTRADFIVKKQQYHAPGSHLDGAYLCYDEDTDSLHYNRTWRDHNAGMERTAMSITVLKQLQREPNEEYMASITKHRQFVEREVFDQETGTVYDEEGKISHGRLYPYPWLSVYYYEWYQLTKEQQCLINSAKILLRFYEVGGRTQEAQCIEGYLIITALRECGLTEWADKLQEAFVAYVEMIYARNFMAYSLETCYVNEMPNLMAAYLLQGYLLTGDKKYIPEAERYISSGVSFYGLQPDYHMNVITARHWDRFWFGRYFQYGDVFPHYWSVLTAQMYYWYQRATGTDCRKLIEANVSGNLCLFRPDGFAANNYLYPYRVDIYASDPEKKMWGELGSFYGKSYDKRANDQDWALYFADQVGYDNGL